ncbi:hypothetical protein AB0D10_39875 [Kitasatospora sp. NPDC048545]|uniref:hypothetical protein n=1 Tax=Kitasatospora sp. NPDC048545 TaxID=3157208 RepID=UPI0033D1DCB2
MSIQTTLQESSDHAAISQRGPVSSVPVHAHMRSGPTRVEYPLDLLILVELGFMFGEQARRPKDAPLLVVTPVSLIERLQGQGVVSANGSRLVSRDSVYDSFKRLRSKGYIRLINLRSEDGRHSAGVAYEYYEWPAYNPDYRPAADPADAESPQVGAASGIAGSANAGSRGRNATNRRSSQVGAASGIAGSGIAGSRGRKTAFPQVGAASGNAGLVPHLQEEVTTSSPFPLMDTSGRGPAAPGEEEVAVFDPEETAAAVRLLQLLPSPWSVGRAKARAFAQALLEAMADQGWPKVTELDDRTRRLLVEQLTKNPGGIKNHSSVLERDRIPNLPLAEIVLGTACIPSQSGGESRPPQLPKEGPDFKPVPAPAEVANLLAGLRKPNI